MVYILVSSCSHAGLQTLHLCISTFGLGPLNLKVIFFSPIWLFSPACPRGKGPVRQRDEPAARERSSSEVGRKN